MAAATVVTARPSQALRQRRESQRSTQSKSIRTGTMENGELPHKEPPPKPYVRDSKYILKKFAGHPPSLVLHLHSTYFRLENQEDTFQYDSPMKLLIRHLKEQTIPHDMLEELYEAGVPFYDGCLIVEVHDHKSSGAVKPSRQTTNTDDGNKSFSIHNYNPFTTPSPYVPYPETKHGTDEANGSAIKKEGEPDALEDDAPGEKDDTAEQTISSSQQKTQPPARVFTLVLHPTGLSKEADMRLLANTPMPDAQSARRQQTANSRTAGTPVMPHPPTPLTSVPPTPLLATKSPKRPKMVIDGSNRYEFEAAMLLETSPKLFLEPTHNLEESLQLIQSLTHPNNKHSPPAPRKRKRTTAELAADEADAAAQQRFALVGDDRKLTAVAADSDEGQVGMRGGALEPRFSRFKTLENIKMEHEEKERRKKEDETRQALHRKQMQAQQQAEKERREEEQRASEQERLLAQRRTQVQMAAAARMNMAQAAQPQQMSNAAQFAQVAQANSQPRQSSPVVSQPTPMPAPSPSLNNVPTTSHPVTGVPMAVTSSNQGGAGSPPRPPSAVSVRGAAQIPMTRQVSQQVPQQVPSRNGTPQLVQGTPQLNNTVPVNRNMTPQPRVNQQNSPVPGGLQGTPVMGQHPQMGNPAMANMTPEQMQALQRQRMQHMQAQRQAQAQMQGNMGSSPHQMSPEQHQHLMMMRAQSQTGQQGMQNPTQQYQQQLARQMSSQLSNANMQDVNGSPPHGQMRPAMTPQLQHMIRNYQETKMRLQQQFPAGLPSSVQGQLQQMEFRIRQAQSILQQRQGGAQPNMAAAPAAAAAAAAAAGMGQMPTNLPPGVTQQQFVAMVQQRQQAQLRQQQMLMQRMGQNPQMNMGNMGMNMAGMPGMGNMQGMQNMMGMQANPAAMGNLQQQMMWMNQGQGRGQGMG